MREDTQRPQINMSKLAVGGGVAGAVFTAGSMLIFLTGIPVLRYIFPAAMAVGCGVALIFHFMRHKTLGAAWILSSTKK